MATNFLDKATGVLIPSGYKTGTLYGIVPNNDNTIGVDADAFDFTFDRNSTATRINEDNLIEEMGIDVPRLEYPSCPSLLLEESRTNLNYPSDISSALISGVAIIDEEVTDTDFYSDDARHISSIGSVYSIVKGEILSLNPTTFSYYSKKVSGNYHVRIAGIMANTAGNITFDDDGIVTSNGSSMVVISSGIETIGNLKRLWFVATPDKLVPSLTTLWYAGVVNGEIYLNDAQTEEGDFVTSLIPTVSTTVTRVKDSFIRRTNLQSDGLLNNEKGSLYLEFGDVSSDGYFVSGQDIYSIYEGSSQWNNSISLSTSGTNPVIRFYEGSTLKSTYSLGTLSNKKIAISWDGSNVKIVVDGTIEHSIAYTSPSFYKDRWLVGNSGFSGKWKSFMMFYNDLTEAEMIELTT